jgi:hypothetical protein
VFRLRSASSNRASQAPTMPFGVSGMIPLSFDDLGHTSFKA